MSLLRPFRENRGTIFQYSFELTQENWATDLRAHKRRHENEQRRSCIEIKRFSRKLKSPREEEEKQYYGTSINSMTWLLLLCNLYRIQVCLLRTKCVDGNDMRVLRKHMNRHKTQKVGGYYRQRQIKYATQTPF